MPVCFGIRHEASHRVRGRRALNDQRASFLVVDLVGDEGVGKTRIAEEVAARWEQGGDGARMVYFARAPGYGKDRPYGSIGALVEAVPAEGAVVLPATTRFLPQLLARASASVTT